MLSVKHPVGPPIPALPQLSEDGSKIPPSVARQQARDVLEKKPTGSEHTSEANDLEEQPGSLASQPRTVSSHREVLARPPAAEKVNGRRPCAELSNIIEPPDGRPVAGEHGARGGVEFALPSA
jgi:hypothetical protein